MRPEQRPPWQDSAEYVHAVRDHVEPLRGTRQHALFSFAYLDVERFDAFLELVAPFVELRGSRVLDSGCGSGGLSARALSWGAASVTGIELDPAVAALAKLRFQSHPNVEIVQEDASSPAFRGRQFDVILSLHVIEHVRDPARYLDETVRLLAPGGVMLLSCPNRVFPLEGHSGLPLLPYLPRRPVRRLAAALERLPGLTPDFRRRLSDVQDYEHDFSARSLKRLAHGAGLEVLAHGSAAALPNALRKRGFVRAASAAELLPSRVRLAVARECARSINLVCRAGPRS